MTLALQACHNLVGLFRHLLVHVAPLVVVLIDAGGFHKRLLQVLLHQQGHRLCTVLHAA